MKNKIMSKDLNKITTFKDLFELIELEPKKTMI